MHSLVHRQHSKHFLERQKEPLFPPSPTLHTLYLSACPLIFPPQQRLPANIAHSIQQSECDMQDPGAAKVDPSLQRQFRHSRQSPLPHYVTNADHPGLCQDRSKGVPDDPIGESVVAYTSQSENPNRSCPERPHGNQLRLAWLTWLLVIRACG